MRRVLMLCVLALVVVCPAKARGQARSPLAAPPPETDLDRFMAAALLRRDIDRQTLSDYVLDEVEVVEILGPGRVPVARMRFEYTWYVRDGMHVRSPVKVNGAPVGETERRSYEDRWIKSEEGRRKFRTEREAKRAQAGKGPALSAPSINEPRFVSESYFMDFKFEPGNYYLSGKEVLDGQQVLKVDYLPVKLFHEDAAEQSEERAEAKARQEARDAEAVKAGKEPERKKQERKPPSAKEQRAEEEIDRKMDKTSQVTLWVDPATHQIVKYTFDNVWLDFLPAGWLVKVDDIRASMQMSQPFPGVWLPRRLNIHAGVSLALGPMEFSYEREFSKYRKADVTSKITVPK